MHANAEVMMGSGESGQKAVGHARSGHPCHTVAEPVLGVDGRKEKEKEKNDHSIEHILRMRMDYGSPSLIIVLPLND